MRRSTLGLSIALALLAAGCTGGKRSASSSQGGAGATFRVTLAQPPLGGTVRSASDAQIYCGSSSVSGDAANAAGDLQRQYAWYADPAVQGGAASSSCSGTYATGAAVQLTPAPAAGMVFVGWAGDCAGSGSCVLSGPGDRMVAAVFAKAGEQGHPNFLDPAVHGPAYLGHALPCARCHGANLQGQGIAPACESCHLAAGFPNWQNNCNFCHKAPPATAAHARVTTDLHGCTVCHPDTVDASGAIIPGGKHMDGVVEAAGHGADYAAPSTHGPAFIDAVGSAGLGPVSCRACHGANFEGGSAPSCNDCHASHGWTDWQTNCSFCHGTRTGTQGGYAFAAHPAWSAPPDDVAARLGGASSPARTGAHQAHLGPSAFALGFKCETCHKVPAGLEHLRGINARAVVTLSGAGQGSLPAALGTYDADPTSPTAGTCATSCHGTRSPAWPATGLACGGCHATPPATAAHASVAAGDLTRCAGCHPDTMNPDGTLNVAGGRHIDGTVQAAGHAAGFVSPGAHGPQFFAYVAGTAGALDCRSCHGASLAFCTDCHASAGSGGWVSWQTNCTFCHGARKASYGGAADLLLAAPPDALGARFGQGAQPLRDGKHGTHLNQFACATCHAVPTDLSHVRGASVRAAVTLSAAGQRLLPSALGTYDPATSTCTTYCHGSTLAGGSTPRPLWSSAAAPMDCGSCHGNPPPTGAPRSTFQEFYFGQNLHEAHLQDAVEWGSYQGVCDAWGSGAGCDSPDICFDCHANDAHLNGRKDVAFGGRVTGTWDAVNKTCTVNCHHNLAPKPWY